MKTEKRHAKVGERILITKASLFENYQNGQEFKATKVGEGVNKGFVWEVEGDILQRLSGISPKEYEVIIEEETEHAEA